MEMIFLASALSAALAGLLVFFIQRLFEYKRRFYMKSNLMHLFNGDVAQVELALKNYNKTTFKRLIQGCSWYQLKSQAVEYLEIDQVKHMSYLFQMAELIITYELDNADLTREDLEGAISEVIELLKKSFNEVIKDNYQLK